MKKILSVALILTLVFALAISSSAATLGTKWTELGTWDVDAAGNSEGTVSVDDNNYITLVAPAGMWWPQAGVKFADMVDVNGLSIVINAAAFSDASPNGYAAVSLSTAAVGDFGLSGYMGGRTYNPTVAGANTLAFSIYGTELKVWVDGITGSLDLGASGITAGTDFTLSFAVDGENTSIKINNTVVKDGEGNDLAVPNGFMTDGKAYLGFAAVGYGGSGSTGIVFKTINGTAANLFGAGGSVVPGPADIEVIAFAGAMIVALVAAAFVVKARKA